MSLADSWSWSGSDASVHYLAMFNWRMYIKYIVFVVLSYKLFDVGMKGKFVYMNLAAEMFKIFSIKK